MMKITTTNPQMLTEDDATRREVSENRRGSTLVVIIALMGMLALLGITFFTFATQEQDNAENFLEAAKHIEDAELGPDKYFNWALRQLISGAEKYEKNSVLWGGRHSLLEIGRAHV